jgi:hypothetical protein
MSTPDELERFLLGHVASQEQIEVLIHEAKSAFLRAAKGRPARSELKSKAESLAKASKEIARCLPSAGDLHFFLRMAETLSSGEEFESALKGLAEAREFDAKTNIVFSKLDDLKVAFEAIAKAARMATDSKRPLPVLAREGTPVDEARRALGFELAALWHCATGKVPAASGSASFESPGTPFGRFVMLAAKACKQEGIIKNGFAGFVRRTCADYRNSKLFKV